MKLSYNILFVLVAVVGLFSACDDRDFDTPPLTGPEYKGEPTHTISEFKQQFNGELDSIGFHVVLTGIVTANDESGNLYKKIVIEDESAAIELSIDRNSLYGEFHMGQQVFVECEGLFTGKYGGLQQVGYKYQSTSGSYQIGRMAKELSEKHIFSHQYPGDKPKSDTISIDQLDESMMSQLVTFKQVRFTNGGKDTFADKDASFPTSQPIVDENGRSIIAYTSQFANFASKTLPVGKGTITGILSYHKGTWQLLIRDLNDVEDFDGSEPDNGGGNGGTDVPVTVVDENFESGKNYDPAAINGWSVVKVQGDRDWQIKVFTKDEVSSTYAQASAHNGTSDDYEYWLFTPAIDMDKAANKIMTFETAKAYWKETSSLEVYVLDGKDPATANKEKLDVKIAQQSDSDFTFIPTGDVDLASHTGVKYIGFKYVAKGGASNSTTFQIDNFKFGVTAN